MDGSNGDGNGDATASPCTRDSAAAAAAAASKQQSPVNNNNNNNNHGYRPRVLYFSVFTWISLTGGRFTAPFLEDQVPHWTSAQIGLCLALQQLVGSLTGSWAGSAADTFEAEAEAKRPPGTGYALCLGTGILSGTVLFLLHGMSHVLDGDNGDGGDGVEAHAHDLQDSATATQQHWSHSTAWHTSLRLLYALATSFVFPVLDGMTLQYLTQTEGRSTDEYGKERLWGAVSWAVTNLVVAYFLDVAGFVIFYPASVVAALFVMSTLYLYTTAAAAAATAATASAIDNPATATAAHEYRHGRLPKRDSDLMLPDLDEDEDEDRSDGNGGVDGIGTATTGVGARKEQGLDDADAILLIPAPPVLGTNDTASTLQMHVLLFKVIGTAYGAAFCLALLTLASGQAVVDGLVFLFFEGLGSSYAIMGVTVVLTVLFEIPIFHVAPDLLHRYGSGPLLLLAGACYAVRVLGYSLIPNNHIMYVLVLEPLHGVTYACSTTAAVAFVAQFMPVGYEASGQGLVYLMKGVGSVTGLWLGGWATDVLGARIMYRGCAVLVLIGMSVFASVTRFHAPPAKIQQPHAILSQTDHDEDDLELMPTAAGVGTILARNEYGNDAFDDDMDTRLRHID